MTHTNNTYSHPIHYSQQNINKSHNTGKKQRFKDIQDVFVNMLDMLSKQEPRQIFYYNRLTNEKAVIANIPFFLDQSQTVTYEPMLLQFRKINKPNSMNRNKHHRIVYKDIIKMK